MSGWIKLHRDIQSHWIFQDAERFKWWIDLILLASYEDNKVLVQGRLVEVKRGQQIASLSFFSERWRKAKGTILKFFELLEADRMIERCCDRKVTILTICNYDSYQMVNERSLTDVVNNHLPIADRSLTELKKDEEVKEIYSSNQRAREEDVSWDADRERGYVETFKGKGAYIPLATKLGKTAKEIAKLLEVYMATRELKNRGHRDYNQFINLFSWHVENGKVVIPAQPQQPQQKKVVSSAQTRQLMKEMGWEDS